jgi:perosamine synthetase
MIETALRVPYHKPYIGREEIDEVVNTLRSGWLTTGHKVTRFEQQFAHAVGAKHALAVNSCTAALHLAVEALKLRAGEAVVVPTMTFAATAEVVLYQGAIPLLVDCDPLTCNMDLADAEQKLAALGAGSLTHAFHPNTNVTGMIPVHVGGYMMDIDALKHFSIAHGLWVVEDAAHAFPAAWTKEPGGPMQRCGAQTSAVTCFSFYANKTITTGEGGIAVTDDGSLAQHMRSMALHGLSDDAWGRYSGCSSWDYQILAPGYKYNLTDIAASIGIHQLAKAEQMRQQREAVACRYFEALNDVPEIELLPASAERIHSWHLFPIKLNLDRLMVDRNKFMEELKREGVGCSVHWRPLHLHAFYQKTFGWRPEHFPAATALWERLISLPIFPGMRDEELEFVIQKVTELCLRFRK